MSLQYANDTNNDMTQIQEMTKQEVVDEITTFGGANQQSLSGHRAQVVQMACAEESKRVPWATARQG